MGRFVQTLARIGRKVDEVETLPPLSVPMRVALGTGLLSPSPQVRGADGAADAAIGFEGGESSPLGLAEQASQEREDSMSSLSFLDPVALPEVEDRRLFQPDIVRPIRRVSGRQVRRMVVPSAVLSTDTAVTDHPKIPELVQALICIRRYTRRGVILALDRGGKNRKGVRSETSNIWCE